MLSSARAGPQRPTRQDGTPTPMCRELQQSSPCSQLAPRSSKHARRACLANTSRLRAWTPLIPNDQFSAAAIAAPVTLREERICGASFTFARRPRSTSFLDAGRSRCMRSSQWSPWWGTAPRERAARRTGPPRPEAREDDLECRVRTRRPFNPRGSHPAPAPPARQRHSDRRLSRLTAPSGVSTAAHSIATRVPRPRCSRAHTVEFGRRGRQVGIPDSRARAAKRTSRAALVSATPPLRLAGPPGHE